MADPAVQISGNPNCSPTRGFFSECMILPSLGSGGRLKVMRCTLDDRHCGAAKRPLDAHRVRLIRRNSQSIHGLALHRGVDVAVAPQGIQCRADNRFGIYLEMATQ